MSHNVKIEGVKISDIKVLERTVKNLAKQGINISLDKCGTFRTWPGQPNQAEYTIHLPDAKYDVGLNRGKDGTWTPVFDNDLQRASPIACAFDPSVDRGSTDRLNNTLGKLMEEYAAVTVEAEAESQGFSTQRQRNEKNQLQVVVDAE